MTDLLTENARLRAALEAIYEITVEPAETDHKNVRGWIEVTARNALATPAPDAPVDWLWYGEDADGKTHVSFGRWQRHPCQSRYKLADIQPVEHDHMSPAPDAVQEAARVPEIAALIEALIEAADNLMLNYLQDELEEPDLCVDEEHWAAIHDLNAAIRAIAGDRT